MLLHISIRKLPGLFSGNLPAGAEESSGIRLGASAVTTRGFREEEMAQAAGLIVLSIAILRKNSKKFAQGLLRFVSVIRYTKITGSSGVCRCFAFL